MTSKSQETSIRFSAVASGIATNPRRGPRCGDSKEQTGQLYAHNTYGWFYVKMGVVGAATFLILIVGVLPALGRHRSSPVSGPQRARLLDWVLQ